jgi:hypothetical protein
MTTQINTTFARPLTSQLTQAQIELVAFYSPAKAIEHLVHAWLALSSATSTTDRASVVKHVAYAHVRLDCAVAAPVRSSLKPRQLRAFNAEIENLKKALANFTL